MNALDKLVQALPSEQRGQLAGMVSAVPGSEGRENDKTEVFSTLVMGWAQRRVVLVTYRPARPPLSARTFEYRFSPYLFEPSGIGRTIYIIGAIPSRGELRTFKLERVEGARLLDERFNVPEGFDGAALLARAWTVMYGNEAPVAVRLRFSKYVARRVKETVWHPTQRIVNLADGGCEWEATIGDATEIGPWVRGWGRDCEVLAPEELRVDVIKHVRHLAHQYGIDIAGTPTADPTSVTADEQALLNRLFVKTQERER